MPVLMPKMYNLNNYTLDLFFICTLFITCQKFYFFNASCCKIWWGKLLKSYLTLTLEPIHITKRTIFNDI